MLSLELNGATLELQPQNYLFQLGPYWPGLYVLGVYDSFGRGTVLGAIALSNSLVIFDRANMRVGFRHGARARRRRPVATASGSRFGLRLGWIESR